MTLTALVRRAHAIGAHVLRIPVPVRFEDRTWRTSTRWVHLTAIDTVVRISHSALPHHPTWTVSAHWGDRPRHYRLLTDPTVADLVALLDDITAVVEPAPLLEPLGQLSLFGLSAS